MRVIFNLIILLFSTSLLGQNFCNPNGNLIVYSNYDGGILNIDVNQNIPNLKIGICTYEPIQVNISGVFVNNVTQVIYAGFNSAQNNNNCALGNFPTSISGVNNSIITINSSQNPPSVGYTPQHGNGAGPWGGLMIGASGMCDTLQNAGGVNTPDEIVYFFQQATGAQLRYHLTQYACWLNDQHQVSQGGNCCILPPVLCQNTLELEANVLQTSCAQNNASIEVLINNQNAGTFTWTPPVSMTNTANNLAPGQYTIVASLNNCIEDTTISILPSLGINNVINLLTASTCNASNGILEVSLIQGGQSPYTYILSGLPLQMNPVFSNLTAGLYTLIVEDSNQCQWINDVTIPNMGAPSFVQVNVENNLCKGGTSKVEILGVIDGIGPYIIQVDGSYSDSLVWGLETGDHMIHVVDINGCQLFQEIFIPVGANEVNVMVPNVFTDNGDNTNDLWCIDFSCVQELKGEIYNRWGNKVHDFNLLDPCWNGRDEKGSECKDGVYFYKIIYKSYEGITYDGNGIITKIN